MSKINAPFVIEHVAAFLPFPQQLLSIRLVSQRFNQAAKKGLIAQLKAIEAQNIKNKAKLLQIEEDPELQEEIHQLHQAQRTIEAFKINKEKMTEVRSFHNPPAIVYPAMNLLAILIRGEPIHEWKKLKPFICNLHLLPQAKEARLTSHKVDLIKKSKEQFNLDKFSITPICKTLGKIDILKFIDARLDEYDLEQSELKEYGRLKEKIRKNCQILKLGFKSLEMIQK